VADSTNLRKRTRSRAFVIREARASDPARIADSSQPRARSDDARAMTNFRDRGEAALYLWDYFYCANAPPPGDEVPWAKIERAMCRIRESESHLEAAFPVDVRLANARRVRNAARLVLRTIAELSAPPEPWITVELGKLERLTADLVEALSKPPAIPLS
jgi:hypothetical protein